MFHLFDEDGQRNLAVALTALASRRPGTVLFGEHVGWSAPRSFLRDGDQQHRFQHSPDSFERLWREVFGAELGPRLDVRCELRDRSQSAMVARKQGVAQADDRWLQGAQLLTWRVIVK